MRQAKRNTVGFLAALIILVGLQIVPMTAKAEETVAEAENGVIYVLDEENCNYKNYWSENADERTAPIRDGYVFGGWYKLTDEETFKPLREEVMATYTGTAYAKFVPAYVLSVRAQIEKATQTSNGDTTKTFIRVISAVDSLNYKETGFDIWYNNKIQEDEAGTVLTTVYTCLENDEGTIYPSKIFGEAASHFSVLKINGIGYKNYSKIIYTRPYWVTMDGTKVEGLSKYVHVEDGFDSNQYISIPINLLTGHSVAGGSMEMTYDATRLDFVDFENGRLFGEYDYNVDSETGIISIIENMETVDEHRIADGIYANMRFKLKDATDNATGLNFTIDKELFCDWSQTIIEKVLGWDASYLFQQQE